MAPQSDTNFAAQIDAVWGDPGDWAAEGYWAYPPVMWHEINRRVTGDPAVTPLSWLFAHIATEHPLPLNRIMVLGCGAGGVERVIAQAGWAREIIGVDISQRVLKLAGDTAAQAGLTNIRYRQCDLNSVPEDADFATGAYDAILGVSSIHHCAELEQLYAQVARMLVPKGWFYLEEYTGPSRFQWTDAQLRHINQLLAILPEALRRTAHGDIKRDFHRVAPEVIAAADPSEAVRSADIIAALQGIFRIEENRGCGGALLHFLLAGIASNFASKKVDPDAPAYLEALIRAEADLQRNGILSDDFSVLITRPIRA